jgi:hypothetical protein
MQARRTWALGQKKAFIVPISIIYCAGAATPGCVIDSEPCWRPGERGR